MSIISDTMDLPQVQVLMPVIVRYTKLPKSLGTKPCFKWDDSQIHTVPPHHIQHRERGLKADD